MQAHCLDYVCTAATKKPVSQETATHERGAAEAIHRTFKNLLKDTTYKRHGSEIDKEHH